VLSLKARFQDATTSLLVTASPSWANLQLMNFNGFSFEEVLDMSLGSTYTTLIPSINALYSTKLCNLL
jgi:hypothetical protein